MIHSSNNILSPRPLYSPRRGKTSKAEDYSYGIQPSVTVPVPLFTPNKSSSVHSVASLDESNSTTDSGFNSVAAAQPLVPSPNSAFSPRYPSFVMQNSLSDTMPMSPVSGTSRASSDVASADLTTDGESSFLTQKPHEPDRVSIYSEPVMKRRPNTSDSESVAESYVYTRGRQRYRGDRNLFLEADRRNELIRSEDRSQSRSRYTTRAEERRQADRKTLFNQFLSQAEERDWKARQEQEAINNRSRNRTRSASLNRYSGTPRTSEKIAAVTANLKRSSSMNSRSRPLSSGGLRRSSSVDIQDMIKQAEKRDRHARVEQARLEGLVPPRRYLGRKDSLKITTRQPASSLIQEFESKSEADSISLTGRSLETDSLWSPTSSAESTPRAEPMDTQRTAKQNRQKTHRKFSSFITKSRLARPVTYQKSWKYNQELPDSRVRGSTWNGTNLRTIGNSQDISQTSTHYRNATYGNGGDVSYIRGIQLPHFDRKSCYQPVWCCGIIRISSQKASCLKLHCEAIRIRQERHVF